MSRLRKKARVVVIELPPEDFEGEDEETQVKDLAFPRLNDHVVGGDEAPRPWPAPEGGFSFPPLGEALARVLEVRSDRTPAPETVSRFRISRERATAASVIVHLLVLLALIVTPSHRPGVPKDLNDENDPLGIMRLWKPDPTPPPIPLQFFPAPGPKAPAPGKNPVLSDQDRKAHGGDPKLPPFPQPRAASKPGIQDLEAGKAAAGAPAAPTPPPSVARGVESGDASARSETSKSLTALRQPKGYDDVGTKRPLVLPPQPLASVRPEEVPVGALFQVKPGERVPLDGVILQGSSALNQAPITGE
ncbi:MAG TPA: hypothetical protein PK598_12095, partial [Thermoanaerobaculia bacterium]|nr:hypothetical protein [Thermoanaerobaculia bacterium]